MTSLTSFTQKDNNDDERSSLELQNDYEIVMKGIKNYRNYDNFFTICFKRVTELL